MNQILAALIFFTRLPFWKIKEVPQECFKHVVSYWSFSGWLTGGMMALIFWGASTILPHGVAVTKAKIESIHFDMAYTSPLSRCTRLAQYCGFGDAIRDPRILELNFGDWEMQYFNKIKDPNLQCWYDDYMNVKATNGESFADQYRRVAAFLDEIKQKEAENIVVFAHSGVLICAQIYAKLIHQEEAFQAVPAYGGVFLYQECP